VIRSLLWDFLDDYTKSEVGYNRDATYASLTNVLQSHLYVLFEIYSLLIPFFRTSV
jgi:hypothetical protein